MATYVYETIPQNENDAPQRFEWKQSMKDAALTTHPETGVPVRRVITGGAGLMGVGSSSSGSSASFSSSSSGGGGGCGSGCGCH